MKKNGGVKTKQGIIVYRVIERPREALKDKLIVINFYKFLGLKLVYIKKLGVEFGQFFGLARI